LGIWIPKWCLKLMWTFVLGKLLETMVSPK